MNEFSLKSLKPQTPFSPQSPTTFIFAFPGLIHLPSPYSRSCMILLFTVQSIHCSFLPLLTTPSISVSLSYLLPNLLPIVDLHFYINMLESLTFLTRIWSTCEPYYLFDYSVSLILIGFLSNGHSNEGWLGFWIVKRKESLSFLGFKYIL